MYNNYKENKKMEDELKGLDLLSLGFKQFISKDNEGLEFFTKKTSKKIVTIDFTNTTNISIYSDKGKTEMKLVWISVKEFEHLINTL